PGDFLVHQSIALGLHTTTLILVKGALDARGSKLMPDKKDFGYSFPCDGPGRGGTCDISAWDAFYLAELIETLAWAHERTPLANLIRWRDKPVALSIVQARLVGLEHFSREKKRQKLEQKYHLIRRSSKKEISKVRSLSDKWEIYGKLQSPPWNSAPTRLHRRCFSTGRPRANYRDFGLSGHILREMCWARDSLQIEPKFFMNLNSIFILSRTRSKGVAVTRPGRLFTKNIGLRKVVIRSNLPLFLSSSVVERSAVN
ncbi:hypothetical protein R6Q59_035930, partial [Mikania micrantha]